MIPTNEGSIRGKCCFKCKWRNPQTDADMCNRNPDGRRICGDVRQVCDMFELDKGRWASLTVQQYEYEYRRKHGGGPLDMFK